MSPINVAVSKIINAPAGKVYPVLADYRNHHPHILPNAFAGLEVEEGGYGEGTRFKAVLQVLGQKQSFRMQVTEPEPGHILAETDLATGLVTTFTVTPGDNGRSEVTIATTFQPDPGLKGWLERLVTPGFMRRIYRAELERLEQYVQGQH